MGKLTDLKNEKPEIFKTQSKTANVAIEKENVPIKVTGYEIGGSLDTNFILGKRVDTKEEIKVRLEEIDQKGSKYKRVEVNEFANPKNSKSHVRVGCFMVFEGARKAPDGSYYARWGVTLDRDPEGTKVLVMNSCLKGGTSEKDGLQSEWFNIQALLPIDPITIKTKEEFENTVSKQLTPKFNGSNPRTFVRIKDEDNEVHIIEILNKRVDVEEDDKKFKRAASDGRVSLDHFIESNKEQYDLIISLINEPEITIELIPSSVLYPGAATKEKMVSMHESSKKILLDSFIVKPSDEEQGEDQKSKITSFGYQPCILATRMYADGTPYVTYIRPVKFFNNPKPIETI